MTGKLPINIDHLLRQRTIEGERIEYKAGWNPQSVLHTICAFANDFHNLGGGYIVLGVEEQNGRPVLPPTGIDPESVEAIQKGPAELGIFGHTTLVSPELGDLRCGWPDHPRPLDARRRNPSLQSQSESECGAQRLGLLHSQTQQHGSRQGSGRA